MPKKILKDAAKVTRPSAVQWRYAAQWLLKMSYKTIENPLKSNKASRRLVSVTQTARKAAVAHASTIRIVLSNTVSE
jgi:hypothetical protein